MKKLLILALLFLSISAPLFAYKPVAVPGGVYLNGVGPIYGVAAGLREIKDESINIMAFKSFGKADAYGLMLDDIPVYNKDLTLRVGYANAEKFEYENTYARELSKGTVVKQELKGKINSFGINYAAFSKRLNLNFNLINTHVEFLDFYTEDGDLIPFSKSQLHDVNTEIKSYSIDYDIIKDKILNAGYSVSTIGGRVAQSDILVHKFTIKGETPVMNKFSLGYYTHYQNTEITKRSGGKSINAKCSTVTSNSTDLARCQQLQGEMSSFIAESNRHGTAAPIGGSRNMRAYRELRFKSATNATQAIEVRRHFFYKVPWQIISSFELAQAADERGDLFQNSVHSVSLGARAFINEIPVRLEVATGDEGETAFLTIGSPW